MKRNEGIEDVLKRWLPSAPTEQMESALERVSRRLWSGKAMSVDTRSTIAKDTFVDFGSRRHMRWLPAAAVIATVLFAIWLGAGWRNRGSFAIVERADGTMYRIGEGEPSTVTAGGRIEAQQTVRANGGTGVLVLKDGSTIEMRSESELRLEAAKDGVRIHLSAGSILVNAAKQRAGRLYVQTKDLMVSVVGTVFLVNIEKSGSHVAVIEGQVHVQRGAESQTLTAGEQAATTPAAVLPAIMEEISWSKNVVAHQALLRQSTAIPFIATAATTTGTIRGVVRHAVSGQPIPEAQIQLMPALGVNRFPAVEAFFSTIPPATQLTPALLDELNAAQATGGRPIISRGSAASPPGPFLNGPGVGLTGPTLTRGTASDANGRFAFADVAPGTYTITVRREGYAGPASPGTNGRTEVMTSPIVVAENQTAPDVQISLVKDATIAGRIVDASGGPISDIRVSVFQMKYDVRGRSTYVAVSSRSTNDRGEYRLFGLAPGEYWIGATPPQPAAEPNLRDNYVKTFFPGSINPRSAAKINLREGEELAGMEFALSLTTKVSVSGRVMNSAQPTTGQLNPIVTSLVLVPLDPDKLWDTEIAQFKNLAPDQSNGQFGIRGVAPGSYDLLATVMDGSGGRLTARTKITVGDRDITGINLTLRFGVEVRARIVFVGPAPSPDPVWLRMRSIETYAKLFDDAVVIPSAIPETSATQFAVPDSTGTYVFRNVPASTYMFQLAGMPDSSIIDIRDAGASVLDGGLTVGAVAPGLVEVMVNPGGETVGGVVYGPDQRPIAGVRVVLVPQQSRRRNAALYKTTATDVSGRFTIPRVAPGEYKVFAWQVPPPRNACLNAEFLARYESNGRAVRVTSGGGSVDVQVSAISEGNMLGGQR